MAVFRFTKQPPQYSPEEWQKLLGLMVNVIQLEKDYVRVMALYEKINDEQSDDKQQDTIATNGDFRT
jgi:hypothetical protein